MRVLLCVFLFVFVKTGEGRAYDDYDAVGGRLKDKTDVFPDTIPEYVPFGHIKRDGFADPFSSVRQPVDGLELSLRSPKDKKEALELLRTAKPSSIIFKDPKILSYYSKPNPKEQMLIDSYTNPLPEGNETMLKWYDLAMIQARNAMRPSKEQYIAKKKTIPLPTATVQKSSAGDKGAYFSGHAFDVGTGEKEFHVNWTTCDQFAVGAVFAPKDVVNVKWTPFYVWDMNGMSCATEHTFEYPSSKLVSEYHLKYSKMVNKTIDWNRAKLLMKGMSEMLLIAADKRGLFHVIVNHALPESAKDYDVKLPSLTLRLKIADPYLVMTFCDQYFATVMAVSGNEPYIASEMIAEAATIKFTGKGRPVWRNFQKEKDVIQAEKNAKLRAEESKNLFIDEPIPPMGQWD